MGCSKETVHASDSPWMQSHVLQSLHIYQWRIQASADQAAASPLDIACPVDEITDRFASQTRRANFLL